MPKINVYLPEDLATAVRESGIPVSPVCQRALAEAVRRVTAARNAVAAIRDPDYDLANRPQLEGALDARMTPRLRTAIEHARQASGSPQRLETKHLLIGLLEQGDNFALGLLQARELDTDGIRAAAEGIDAEEARPTSAAAEPTGAEASLWTGMSLPARMAIASMIEAAIDLAHNYLGCEHLLLGLLDVQDSEVARVLRDLGIDQASVRRGVNAAVNVAVAHERTTTAGAHQLDEIIRRLDALDRRLSSIGA